MSRDRVSYAAFLVLALLDSVGYGIIGPIVPAISTATGAGPALTGALVATFGIGMALGFYPAGLAVRRYGSVTVLAVAVGLSAVGAATFLAPIELPLVFAGRLLMGFAAGGLWMGIALGVVERWPGGEYKRLAGVMAMYSAGAIAGPALAGVGGIREPFAAYLGLLAVGAVALLLLGPPHRDAPAFTSDREALRRPGFAVSAAAITLVSVTVGMFDGVLPLHLDDHLGQEGIAVLYAASGVIMALFSILGARVAIRTAVVVGAVALIAGLSLVGVTGAVPWWVLAVAVTAVGFGLSQTGSLGYLLGAVGTDRMILAMVVWSQLFALGYLVGPIVGGIVAATLGYAAIGLVSLALGAPVFAALARMPRTSSPPGERAAPSER